MGITDASRELMDPERERKGKGGPAPRLTFREVTPPPGSGGAQEAGDRTHGGLGNFRCGRTFPDYGSDGTCPGGSHEVEEAEEKELLCAFTRRRHWVKLPLKLPHSILQQAHKREGFSYL